MTRRRKILIATGVGVTVFVAAALVWSLWWRAFYGGRSFTVELGAGRLMMAWSSDPGGVGLIVSHQYWPVEWTPRLRTFSNALVSQVSVVVPLWIPLLLVATPTGVLIWRARREFGPGACGKCGYDLRGIGAGVCPECGSKA